MDNGPQLLGNRALAKGVSRGPFELESMMRLAAAALLALLVPLHAEEAGPRRLVVFLVDSGGTLKIADALTCPMDVRVNRATGEPDTLGFVRYSFTPHPSDLPQHWTMSF